MNLHAIFFLFIFFVGEGCALLLGPIWGLLTYIFIYFNIPSFHFWGAQIPTMRWSFISAAILCLSCFLHKDALSDSKFFSNGPLKCLMALLLLMVAIVPFSYNPTIAWKITYDFFRYVLVFYLISIIVTDFFKYRLLIYTIIINIFHLCWLAHYYFRGSRLDGVGLPDGGEANMFSLVIVMVIPLIIILLLYGNIWERIGNILILPFILNAFAMCRSRGSFLALIIAIITLLCIVPKRDKLKIYCGTIIFIIGLSFFVDSVYIERLVNLSREGEWAQKSAGRTAIWGYVLPYIKDYPIGAGGNAFQKLSPKYLPSYLLNQVIGERASHNTYLLVLIEQGPLGLIIYIFFIFSLLSILHKIRSIVFRFQARQLTTDEDHLIVKHTYGLEALLMGFCAGSFFCDRLYFELIYIFTGLIPVLFGITRKLLSKTSQ